MILNLSSAKDETERFFGGYSEKVTPVPIPNTVVKLLCADNTWRVTARKPMSLPEFYSKSSNYAALGYIIKYIPL